MKKDVMINGVKGCRQVKETKTGSLLRADSSDEVIEKG
jgi:hypothetical protein